MTIYIKDLKLGNLFRLVPELSPTYDPFFRSDIRKLSYDVKKEIDDARSYAKLLPNEEFMILDLCGFENNCYAHVLVADTGIKGWIYLCKIGSVKTKQLTIWEKLA